MKLSNVKSFMLNFFFRDERGVTAIEYAIVAVAISTLVSVAFTDTGALGQAFSSAFEAVSGNIATAGGGAI